MNRCQRYRESPLLDLTLTAQAAAHGQGKQVQATPLPPAGTAPTIQAPFRCPVPGCAAHSPDYPGWVSFNGQKAHVNGHVLGVLPGRPPDEWMAKRATCAECGKLVSKSVAGHIHRTCLAANLQAKSQSQKLTGHMLTKECMSIHVP